MPVLFLSLYTHNKINIRTTKIVFSKRGKLLMKFAIKDGNDLCIRSQDK
jgi:dTDP-glucose pyrophosphorylase